MKIDNEEIFKKLDEINERLKPTDPIIKLDDIPNSPWIVHNQWSMTEEKYNKLDNKLDWIAYRLMKLTLSVGEGMTGEEVNEYTELFKT